MKIFNTLDEILEFTGCDVAIPTNHPLGKYAVFEVVEPYNCKYLDWATERGILQLDIFVKGKTLIAYLPKYSEIGEKESMEQYIASYKHLIGCEYVGSWFKSLDGATTWLFTEDKLKEFYIKSKPLLFITDKNYLVNYKEYMSLYYPEYEHVWSKQL